MDNETAAMSVYKMLAFQYKPVEAWLKKNVDAETWKKYQGAEPAKKIAILDKTANFLGL